MSIALCLACGEAVEENAFGDWESADGAACSRRPDGHLVTQIVPDPEGPS